MKIRVIVLKTLRSCSEYITQSVGAGHSVFKIRQILEAFVQSEQSVREKFKTLAIQKVGLVLDVRFASGVRFGGFTD
jgi:hypothetical protein